MVQLARQRGTVQTGVARSSQRVTHVFDLEVHGEEPAPPDAFQAVRHRQRPPLDLGGGEERVSRNVRAGHRVRRVVRHDDRDADLFHPDEHIHEALQLEILRRVFVFVVVGRIFLFRVVVGVRFRRTKPRRSRGGSVVRRVFFGRRLVRVLLLPRLDIAALEPRLAPPSLLPPLRLSARLRVALGGGDAPGGERADGDFRRARPHRGDWANDLVRLRADVHVHRVRRDEQDDILQPRTHHPLALEQVVAA